MDGTYLVTYACMALMCILLVITLVVGYRSHKAEKKRAEAENKRREEILATIDDPLEKERLRIEWGKLDAQRSQAGATRRLGSAANNINTTMNLRRH